MFKNLFVVDKLVKGYAFMLAGDPFTTTGNSLSKFGGTVGNIGVGFGILMMVIAGVLYIAGTDTTKKIAKGILIAVLIGLFIIVVAANFVPWVRDFFKGQGF